MAFSKSWSVYRGKVDSHKPSRAKVVIVFAVDARSLVGVKDIITAIEHKDNESGTIWVLPAHVVLVAVPWVGEGLALFRALIRGSGRGRGWFRGCGRRFRGCGGGFWGCSGLWGSCGRRVRGGRACTWGCLGFQNAGLYLRIEHEIVRETFVDARP